MTRVCQHGHTSLHGYWLSNQQITFHTWQCGVNIQSRLSMHILHLLPPQYALLHALIRYTAFLASVGGIYVAVDEGLATLLGKDRQGEHGIYSPFLPPMPGSIFASSCDRTSRWRSLMAGAVAGQMLVLTGSKPRHYSLATYVMLRGLTLLVRTGNKPTANPIVRKLLAPTRLQ